MTREEAIKILEAWAKCSYKPTHDAAELAISALRAQQDTPNDPLTLEELREIDGEPVWVERYDGGPSRWAIVGDFESLYGVYFCTAQGGLRLPYDEYGKTWLAYRRKQEEGTV